MTSLKKFLSIMISAASLAATATAADAADIFLDADIEGDATQEGYEGQIVLFGFNFGLGVQTNRNGSIGGCQLSEIEMTKMIDMATADLVQAAALRTSLGDVVITIVGSGGDGRSIPVLELTLLDAFITRHSIDASAGDLTRETLQMRFQDVRGVVFNQNNDGSTTEEPFDVQCF